MKMDEAKQQAYSASRRAAALMETLVKMNPVPPTDAAELLGAAKQVQILTASTTVRRIVNMTAIAVADIKRMAGGFAAIQISGVSRVELVGGRKEEVRIAVDPARQGRGLGVRLVRAVEDAARAAGAMT